MKTFFAMAEENIISCGGSGDGDDDPFGDANKKRIETVNKMLKYNRRKERLDF